MVLKELFAKLGLDIDHRSFTLGDVLIESTRKGLVMLGSAALVGGAALGALVSRVSEKADAFDEAAQSVGVGVEALQELAYAASFSGLGLDNLKTSLGILARQMRDARGGSEEAQKAFRDIGVSVTDATGALRPMDAVMMDVADRFKSMPNGAEKTALAMKIFGRSGAALIPFLNEGSAGIAKLRTEARELGIVLDEQTIKQGVALDDALTSLKGALVGVGNALAGSLFNDVKDLAEGFSAWVRANRDLIRQRLDIVVGLITGALSLAWKVFRALTSAVEFGVRHWQKFAAVLGGIALAAILANAKALGLLLFVYRQLAIQAVASAVATASAWLAAAAPFIGLAVAMTAVVAVVWDLVNAFTGGASVLRDLWDLWRAFIDDLAQNEADDFWLTTAIKSVLLTVSDLKGAWRDAIDDLKRYAEQFFNWLDAKFSKYNFLGRFGNYIGESLADDGTEGMVNTRRGFAYGAGSPFGGGSSPEASAASSGARQRAAIGTFAPSLGITVNGVTDPKAVAAEVDAKVGEHLGRMLRDFGAVAGT